VLLLPLIFGAAVVASALEVFRLCLPAERECGVVLRACSVTGSSRSPSTRGGVRTHPRLCGGVQ
jgi:hypothetical protein